MRSGNENAIPATLLSQLSQSVETAMGLHYPSEKWRHLADGVAAAAGPLGFEDVESCLRQLVTAPLTRQQIEHLAPHLTVGETYFLRESACFSSLQEDVLPKLIGERRRDGRQVLRIWSAGCATGEEAYSIAILLERLIPDIDDWQISILGTDINPAFLKKACAGRYGEWSFRGVPGWVKERYFRRTKEARFEIQPRIRRRVTFDYLNLAEDSYPALANGTSACDVVFCRNVLMYFAPHAARRVVRRLHRSLCTGGWLVLGATDGSHELCSEFSAVTFPGATLYRKDGLAGASARAGSSSVAPATTVSEALLPLPSPPTRTKSDSRPASPPAPAAADVSYEAALALYTAGHYDGVVAKLTDLPTGHPSAATGNDGRALELLIRAHTNLGELAAALRCCEIAVARDKLNPEKHYLLAMILQEHGRAAEAVLCLRQALYLDQDFVPAHFALGNLARQQARPQEAVRHYRNARALLERCAPDAIVPQSEGMTAGSLNTIIASLLDLEASA